MSGNDCDDSVKDGKRRLRWMQPTYWRLKPFCWSSMLCVLHVSRPCQSPCGRLIQSVNKTFSQGKARLSWPMRDNSRWSPTVLMGRPWKRCEERSNRYSRLQNRPRVLYSTRACDSRGLGHHTWDDTLFPQLIREKSTVIWRHNLR